jgi:hypothetical protein
MNNAVDIAWGVIRDRLLRLFRHISLVPPLQRLGQILVVGRTVKILSTPRGHAFVCPVVYLFKGILRADTFVFAKYCPVTG